MSENPQENDAIPDYNEDDIVSLTRLQHYREKPTGYIPDRGPKGLIHHENELITNVFDEMILNPKVRLVVMLFNDSKNSVYQSVVYDTGRGIPIKALNRSYTVPWSGAKFKSTSYRASGGQFGTGCKVVTAQSSKFRAVCRRPDGIGSIYVENGEPDDVVEVVDTPQLETGQIVVHEPDKTIFTDANIFANDGYDLLLLMLQKHSYFNDYDIELRVSETPFPVHLWKVPADHFVSEIKDLATTTTLVYSSKNFDRQKFLKSYFGLTKNFAWSDHLSHITNDINSPLQYQLEIYYAKISTSEIYNRYFGVVNNVPMDDDKSDHVRLPIQIMKEFLAEKIENKDIKKYFLEKYNLQLFVAVNIKYDGAELAGLTKTGFYDETGFGPMYTNMIRKEVGNREESVESLYSYVYPDVEARYNASLSRETVVKDVNRLYDELNFPDKRIGCLSNDRTKTELFLVEGDSAGDVVGRDAEYQAFYLLRGKPLNAIKHINSKRSFDLAIQKIKDDLIYQDIFKTLNINVNNPNIDNLNYSKIIIMTDSDPHGYHISEILLANLYLICPDLINSGHIYLAMPALIALKYKRKKEGKKLPSVYLRNHDHYVDWMSNNVFGELFDIFIGSTDTGALSNQNLIEIKGEDYRDFVKVILDIGDDIDALANELVLDSFVVEALTHVTQYLDYDKVNTDRIADIIGADRVIYHANSHILIISYGRIDYTVPLQKLRERFYTSIIPKLNKIAYKKLVIKLTSKHNDKLNLTQTSIMQLHKLLRSDTDLFDAERFKGLGQMNADAFQATCLDPATRNIYQITSIGDAEEIFDLLGGDSVYKKRLVSGTY